LYKSYGVGYAQNMGYSQFFFLEMKVVFNCFNNYKTFIMTNINGVA